jgi:hypothetical protein
MSGQSTGRLASRWLLFALVVLVVPIALTLSVGLTDAYGTGKVLQVNVGGGSDGAAHDTFWDTPVFDIPGASMYAVHCHGQMRYEVQLGAVGPSHNNPCYAGLGLYSHTAGEQIDSYMLLPFGDKVLYRCSTTYGPWIYYIDNVFYASDMNLDASPGPPPEPRNPCAGTFK